MPATAAYAPPLSRILQWLVVLLAVRLGVMLLVVQGADLAGDEAYYWDWGRRPDWGYYSKPPMIGWMMAAIGRLTGHAEWGIRAAALLLGTGMLAVTWRLARDLFGGSVAGLAALLVLLTPGNAGLCLLLTIDAPLLLAWTLALWLYWRAAALPASWTRWAALGLVIGFGCLSKQMMLVFPLLMVVHAALSPEDRPLLRNTRYWTAILLGLLFMLPVLKWNQEHGWITLEHTRHHFDTQSLTWSRWLGRLGENVGLQALIYTPVLFVALVLVLWRGLGAFRTLSRPERFLWLFSAPALACFALLALRQRINPNWPAAFFVPAVILTARWLLQAPQDGWRRWTLRTAAVLAALIHLALVITMSTGLQSIGKVASLRGWKEAGAQADAFLAKLPRRDHTFVMALGHRYHAAWMSFYMPSHPRLYRWEPSGTPQSQYEVWTGPEERIGDDALILDPTPGDGMLLPAEVKDAFQHVARIGTISIPLGADQRTFGVYHAQKLTTWKAIRPQASPAEAACCPP
jgi:4-amino-4-deoxy-L-arabinose transferase-like glycosyltransferase